jgi:ATP synthase I chain
MDFGEHALRRIRILTIAVGLVGAAVVLGWQGDRPALGFLLGAGLSVANLEGLSKLVYTIGASRSPGPVAAMLIALRYLLIGIALYVIVKILGFAPAVVLAGLLTAFGAVLLEVLYELVFGRGSP